MASLVQYALHAARAPMNALAFHLRSVVPARRGVPELRAESSDGAFDYLHGARRTAAERRAAEIVGRYDLEPLRGHCPQVTWRECIATIDGLERLIGSGGLRGECVRAVDVGAGDWHYVFGLERFLRRGAGGGLVELTGVELDGRVRCRDLRCRADHARARAAQCENPRVRYLVDDFVRSGFEQVDVVTLLYPFVTPYAFLAWGLPVYHYRPAAMVRAAVAALAPGGHVVVFHQTAEERERFAALLETHPVEEHSRCSLATDLVHYWDDTDERCAVLYRKVVD